MAVINDKSARVLFNPDDFLRPEKKLISKQLATVHDLHKNMNNEDKDDLAIYSTNDLAKIINDITQRLLQLPEVKLEVKDGQKDPTCVDSANGLEWQGTHPYAKMNWEDAKNYADVLSYGGFNDWRVPTIKELLTLVDYEKIDPACVIDNCQSGYYWSSTTYADYTSHAWLLNFYYGNGSWNNKTYSYYVRCVRTIQREQGSNLVAFLS